MEEVIKKEQDYVKINSLYLEEVKETRKELIKFAKYYNSWDYEYMLNFIETIIKDWIKYYGDEKFITKLEKDERLEIIKKMDDLMEEYDDLEDDRRPKQEVMKELFNYMADNLYKIWD